MYLHPCRPSRCPDGQLLLGAVLPGARHPARRYDAQRHLGRKGERRLQHILQRDRQRQARAACRVRRPRAFRRR